MSYVIIWTEPGEEAPARCAWCLSLAPTQRELWAVGWNCCPRREEANRRWAERLANPPQLAPPKFRLPDGVGDADQAKEERITGGYPRSRSEEILQEWDTRAFELENPLREGE